ncbi:class I SAM-dependent methyltransferase [Candidatus Contubernalis alkaliaceticus]|uniref:class I SAM-dependent methyltransferase n=1 Tax=Candidatus Contubernalis alkaliaceticus TaxID=338645 RepID=UPI001F4C1077|nr:class I SAM-dependent methyltransferase [Candidatus Contubernalis alkalaceticus]UNC90820.1 methyltransferase domain-containing protein [Candidatus Contubernalis alkalaceticus]
MSNVEEKLAMSLTAESTELIPYLPYLLQDLWELGSSPKDIIYMVSKHINTSNKTKVLDLACGKGAVSIHLAKDLGCKVKGIDIISEFIVFADKKAQEYGVETCCEFTVGDINVAVENEKDYDIVILGAVGNVLGSPEETLIKLKSTVKNSGYIFIDDVYGKDDSDIRYPTRAKWLMIFQNSGLRLIDEKLIDDDELRSINVEQQAFILRRANELKKIHPEKASLFESYVQSQQAECDELENEISGVTMLLQVVK